MYNEINSIIIYIICIPYPKVLWRYTTHSFKWFFSIIIYIICIPYPKVLWDKFYYYIYYMYITLHNSLFQMNFFLFHDMKKLRWCQQFNHEICTKIKYCITLNQRDSKNISCYEIMIFFLFTKHGDVYY